MADHRELPEVTDGRAVALGMAAEAGEIVLADEGPGGLPHRREPEIPGRCHTNRAVNGSGSVASWIRYTYSRDFAEYRAWKPSAASRASRTTTSGASALFSAFWSRSGGMDEAVENDVTCPRA